MLDEQWRDRGEFVALLLFCTRANGACCATSPSISLRLTNSFI